MSKNQLDRVWQLANGIKICMLTTLSESNIRSRPMHAMADRENNCLWFITDQRGAKDEEIKDSPNVCLAFSDISQNAYLSISGRAEMVRDPVKARELWSTEAQAWWPNGPTDPDVRVLRVFPDHAEYWDTRGNSIIVSLKLVAARLSGIQPSLGENEKVQLS
jgi:general stress protein 26